MVVDTGAAGLSRIQCVGELLFSRPNVKTSGGDDIPVFVLILFQVDWLFSAVPP